MLYCIVGIVDLYNKKHIVLTYINNLIIINTPIVLFRLEVDVCARL